VDQEKELRAYLKNYLDWHEAHADLKAAVKDFPEKLRGTRPAGAPHSGWELLEHIRISTHDILEFSRDAKYASPDWPSGYWPKTPAPPSAAAWEKSVKALERDLSEMGKLASNPKTDLFAKIPHGTGQTILREVLLIADHNAYHIGQLVLVRRLLGCWPES
jgi:DinB superfamily